jgi:S1-C subfamily serine protease
VPATPRRAWSQLALALAAAAAIGGCGATAATAPAPAPAQPPAAAAPAQASAAPRSYAPVVDRILPSVVLIRTAAGLGSGVVLDHQGHIVTNAHVVGDSAEARVQLAGDQAPRSARLVGMYRPDDLAVLQVKDTAGLRPAQFADSSKVRIGDVVLAVGNPLGLSSSVTDGIVSATGRAVSGAADASSPAATLPGAIQTSAPINPGNSGGALVDMSARVIGIPTLAAANPANGAPAAGIGFAIPSNVVRDIAGQLIKFGHVVSSGRAALGIQATTQAGADGSPAGARVAAVTPGGPAQRAGLRPGDVIRAVDDTSTPSSSALSEVLASLRPGQAVSLTVVRADAQVKIPLTLGQLP